MESRSFFSKVCRTEKLVSWFGTKRWFDSFSSLSCTAGNGHTHRGQKAAHCITAAGQEPFFRSCIVFTQTAAKLCLKSVKMARGASLTVIAIL